jgi:hypothetical protein
MKAPPSANSFCGLRCSNGVGHLTACGAITWGAPAPARSALKTTKKSLICSSVASMPVRSGSVCYGLRHWSTSPLNAMAACRIGGAHRGSGFRKRRGMGFNTMVALACWGLWKERNRRIFDNTIAHAAQLSSLIMEEGRWWAPVGYRDITTTKYIYSISW